MHWRAVLPVSRIQNFDLPFPWQPPQYNTASETNTRVSFHLNAELGVK